MAHRVLGAYTERCQGLHGHSYKFEVFVGGEGQDSAQMLIDFKLLKEAINPILDAFDHSLIIWEKDLELLEKAKELNKRYIVVPYNPTAEQIARHIFYACSRKIGTLSDELFIEQVIVHETDTGYAQFQGDDKIDIDLSRIVYSTSIGL